MPRARTSNSPYMRQKAQQPYHEQIFGPWRVRQLDTTTIAAHAREFNHHIKRDKTTGQPIGKPRFWQLPPEYRHAAEAYEYALCQKWASRILQVPNFRRVLHMITVNQFKNPGQSREAWWKGRGQMAKVRKVRKSLMREVLGDGDNRGVKLPPAGVIRRLPL